MEAVFRQTHTLSDIHVDCFGRLKASVLLYLAQEAAGGHCIALHTDWQTLKEQNMFWAIIRHRVQITRIPMKGETITVETWPLPTTRSAFPRSTVAYDEKGQEVFRTIGLWVLMDTRSRKMILPAKSGILVPGTVRGGELAVPGSLVPYGGEGRAERTVGYTDLDINGHMNNTRYMDWVDDLIPSAFHREHPLKEFTVCYLNEAKEGQKLTLNWNLGEGPVFQLDAHRNNPDGGQERVFSAQLIF